MAIHSGMGVSFRRHQLSNGLNIIAEVDPDAHTSAAGFFVRTGARDEEASCMGVSHFLEHMMFKGTADISADELNRRFDAIGARNNAYTSNELTCFYAHVLPEHLASATDLLGRMLRPALNDADFQTERGVILEEIAMYQDNPSFVLYEETISRHFGPHPLSHRVLGTPETISAMTSLQMREYFTRRYSADNTVAAFAGRVDFDAVCRQVESLCGGWERTGATRESTPPPLAGGRFDMHSAKVSRGYLLTLAPAPAIGDDRRYAAALAAQVLGAADNSRLHWSLIEPGIADEAQASYDAHDGFGEFMVYASGEPGRMPEIMAAIERESASLADSLKAEDLSRLLEKLATGIVVGGERPNDRMQRLGRLWTYLGTYRTLEEELDRVRAVTVSDVRGVLGAFPMKAVTEGRLLPQSA